MQRPLGSGQTGWRTRSHTRMGRRECLALLAAGAAGAATAPNLIGQWREIAGKIDGTVGASVLHLTSGFQASLNGAARFPLASVCSSRSP